jgi:hypothetical protein
MNPPTDCVSPIGEELIRKGLQKEIGEAEFFVSRTRPPAVYRGNPFQIEVGWRTAASCRPRSWSTCGASPTACRCSTSNRPAPSRAPR